MTLKVGVVGLGVAGQKHIESLKTIEGVDLVALADLDRAKTIIYARDFKGRCYSSWQELLEGEKELDALILCTTSSVRKEPIEAAFSRKIAVFCEKPISHDLKIAYQLAGLAQQSGAINAVGFQYRWHPLAERFKDALRGKRAVVSRCTLARPMFDLVQEAKAPRSFLYKAQCGGPIVEQGSHFIDLLRYLTDDEPVEVQGMAEIGSAEPQDRDSEETTSLMIKHRSGMLSSHIVNWSHRETILKVNVTGIDFDVSWNVVRPSLLYGRYEGRDVHKQVDVEPFELEMQGFVEAVRQREQSLVRSSIADACKTQLVCEAATRAVATGRKVKIEH